MTPLTEQQQKNIDALADKYAGYAGIPASYKTAEYILTHLSEFLPDNPGIKEISERAKEFIGNSVVSAYYVGTIESPYRALYEAATQEHAASIEMLHEAKSQIEYLHGKFKETGSGNDILSRIDTLLQKHEPDTLKAKHGFVRLAMAEVEEASSTPEKAREYLESQ